MLFDNLLWISVGTNVSPGKLPTLCLYLPILAWLFVSNSTRIQKGETKCR